MPQQDPPAQPALQLLLGQCHRLVPLDPLALQDPADHLVQLFQVDLGDRLVLAAHWVRHSQGFQQVQMPPLLQGYLPVLLDPPDPDRLEILAVQNHRQNRELHWVPDYLEVPEDHLILEILRVRVIQWFHSALVLL